MTTRSFAALALILAGCATAPSASDRKQTVSIYSIPSGADVFVDGDHIGTTPTNAMLALRTHRIALRKAGYEELIEYIAPRPRAPSSTALWINPSDVDCLEKSYTFEMHLTKERPSH